MEPLMDWEQVRLNGGPPCFHVETNTPDDRPRFCGRAERWQGHGVETFHVYVSLQAYLAAPGRKRDIAVEFIDFISRSGAAPAVMWEQMRLGARLWCVELGGSDDLPDLMERGYGASDRERY